MALLLNIDVPDLEAGERFYSKAFGLSVARRFGDDVAELVGWPVPLFLLVKRAGTVGAGGDLRRYDRHWTPIHPDIVVKDLESAVARALGAGATLESPPADVPYGRIAILADPFGHGFCLLQFNARGYDALLRRQRPTAVPPARHQFGPVLLALAVSLIARRSHDHCRSPLGW